MHRLGTNKVIQLVKRTHRNFQKVFGNLKQTTDVVYYLLFNPIVRIGKMQWHVYVQSALFVQFLLVRWPKFISDPQK